MVENSPYFAAMNPLEMIIIAKNWIGNSTVYLFAMVLGKKIEEKIQLFWYLLKKLDFKNHIP